MPNKSYLSIFLLLISTISVCTLSVSAQNQMTGEEKNLRKQLGGLISKAKTAGPKFTVAGIIDDLEYNHVLINGEKITLDENAKTIGNLHKGSSARVRGLIINGEKIANLLVANEKTTSKLQNNSKTVEQQNQGSFDGIKPEALLETGVVAPSDDD